MSERTKTRGGVREDGEDWSELDRNPLNRSVRVAKVAAEAIATCSGCGGLFFVEVDQAGLPLDGRLARRAGRLGWAHRTCGGGIRLWRWNR